MVIECIITIDPRLERRLSSNYKLLRKIEFDGLKKYFKIPSLGGGGKLTNLWGELGFLGGSSSCPLIQLVNRLGIKKKQDFAFMSPYRKDMGN